jgi:hypothetical protein
MRPAHALLLSALVGPAGCAAHAPRAAAAAPPMLLGEFVDDYGIGHRVDAQQWLQRRDAPKTGCNGYPFSRMRPLPQEQRSG